jgi:hypothetical protein
MVVVLLSLLHAAAFAEEERVQPMRGLLIPEVFHATDSERFSTNKIRTGFLPTYTHGERYTGVAYQQNRYAQDAWSTKTEQVSVITKAINPRTGLGYQLNVGLGQSDRGSLLTTDSSYGFQLSDQNKMEVFANRDRVETQQALNNGIYYTLVGTSLEHKVTERLSAIVLGGAMLFSDNNTRPIVRARVIYDLDPTHGVTVQLRFRQFRDTDTLVTNHYFNPTTYSETMALIGMRRRIEGWVVSGLVGVGRQAVNQDPDTQTKLLELSVVSPVARQDYYLKARAGYSKSEGWMGPNYLYRHITGELVIPF